MSFKRCLVVCVSVMLTLQGLNAQTVCPGPKNAIKATLLSIWSGSSRFTYERSLDCKHSMEITAGIVGLGVDKMNDAEPQGFILKGAFKWNISPISRSYTALDGLYIKPELIYANYRDRYITRNDELTTNHTQRWALLGEIGWQKVWGWFLLDIYGGLGPSFGNKNPHNYYHGFMLFPADGHIAYTAGFRIGVAF